MRTCTEIINEIPVRSIQPRITSGGIEPYVLVGHSIKKSGEIVKKRFPCWLELMPQIDKNWEEYNRSLLHKICFQREIGANQNLSNFESLECDELGNLRANMIGFENLIRLDQFSSGDDGVVFFVEVRPQTNPNRAYRAIWADSIGAAIKFLQPFTDGRNKYWKV